MRINIHYKITFILTLIIALILVGFFLYFSNNLRQQTYHNIRANLINQAYLCKTYLEETSVKKNQDYELDKIADKIGKSLNLGVTIISPEGRVLGDSNLDQAGLKLKKEENYLSRPEIKEALNSNIGESRRFNPFYKKNMLYIATTYGKDRLEGIVRLSIPLSEIGLFSNSLKKAFVFLLLSILSLAIIINFSVLKLISQPLKKVSLGLREIGRGNFSERVIVSSADEIGDLARVFNYMSEQIKLKFEELNLSKSRLETIILSMFEGVMVVDSKGLILLMNPALKELFMVKDKPFGKKPIEVIRNVEIQEIVERALTLKKGYRVESSEISIFSPDEKILSINATPVIREGNVEGAVLVFHNITELRRLEKIRQDFVANVSHELRTPLSSIKGYAETLLEGALEDKENARDFLKIIYSDSERLARLVDDILELSRIESGKLNISLKSCKINPLIERVVCSLDKQAKEKSILIKVDVREDLPLVYADEIRIAQVLFNLIDNAIKYNQEGGKVVISAKDKGKFVQIDVSDTGIGIPEKDLPRLFERFYRVDKARSRQLGGTGLGLSIVKHIISAHKGEVSVQSILGQGSTFSFTLPKP